MPSPLLIISFSKDLFIACERKSVSYVIDIDPLHSLLASLLTDIQGFDHRLDVLLAGQLQHGQHLRPVTDMASSHFGPIRGEILGLHLGQWLIW